LDPNSTAADEEQAVADADQIVDITVIGGGPTGLAAAYYGGHRDATVRIVESLEQLG